jgi:hypothetical protein
VASAVDARPARPAGAPLNFPPDLVILVLLALPAELIGWQIASVWSWPAPLRLLWLGASATLVLIAVLRPFLRDLAGLAAVASLYAVPVVGGIVRWRLQASGTAVIGDGAMQTQLAGSFLLRGIDPYGADYAAAGLGRAPWNEPFSSPALHHLVTWPGQFLLPLPLQAASTATAGWWDERWFLLLAAAAIWILLGRLLPGVPGRVAAIAVFLLPLHSLIAVLGDNDLPAVALVLAALLAADHRRFLLTGALLGLAIATKQHALLAVPIVLTWAAVRGAPRRSLALAGGAGLAVAAVLVLPFLIWNPSAFVQDTVTFLVGSGAQAYPINGMGLSAFLLHAGAIHGARDAFPFALFEIVAAAAVWIGAWRWLRRHRQPADVLTWCGLAFLLVLFVSRYFHDTHLLLGAELIAAGVFARWAARSRSRQVERLRSAA